jgi:chromosome segregation ATPase
MIVSTTEHLSKLSSDVEEVVSLTLKLIQAGDAKRAQLAGLADGQAGMIEDSRAALGGSMDTVDADRLRAEVQAAREELAAMRVKEKEMEQRVVNAEEGEKVSAAAFTRTRKDMEMFQARNAALEKEVADLKSTVDIEKMQQELVQARQQIEALQTEVETNKKALEGETAEKDKIASEMDAKMKESESQIAEMQTRMDQVTQENVATVRNKKKTCCELNLPVRTLLPLLMSRPWAS